MVSRQSCAAVARELELGSMLAERGGDVLPEEELESLVRNRNVLAAVLEAALAAAFLEWGFEQVEPAVVAAFAERIDYAATEHVDYKTELQETLARRRSQVVYTVLSTRGPRARAPVHLRRPHRRTSSSAPGKGGRRRTPSRRPPARRSRGSPPRKRSSDRGIRPAR